MSRYTKHAPEDFPYEEYLPVANVDEYDAIGRLGKLEDIIYAPDGTEIVSLDRLRKLVEADRDGRLVEDMLKVLLSQLEKEKDIISNEHGKDYAHLDFADGRRHTLMRVEAWAKTQIKKWRGQEAGKGEAE